MKSGFSIQYVPLPEEQRPEWEWAFRLVASLLGAEAQQEFATENRKDGIDHGEEKEPE